MTRNEARLAGEKYYTSGKVCKQNHENKRLVVNGDCFYCAKDRDAKRNNSERAKEYRRKNPDYASQNSKAYYLKNKQKERQRAREYRKQNRGKVNALNSLRRALKMRALPEWADQEAIEAIYLECRDVSLATGVKHHVDHVVPLNGELVSGLHCEANLQILTAAENVAKKNRFEV